MQFNVISKFVGLIKFKRPLQLHFLYLLFLFTGLVSYQTITLAERKPFRCETLLLTPDQIVFTKTFGMHRNPEVTPAFLSSLSIDNREYIQENIRTLYNYESYLSDPYRNDYFKNYIENMIASTVRTFDVEFRSGRLSKNLKEILKKQHFELTTSGYHGFMANAPGTTQITPGLMVFELSFGQNRRIQLPLRGYGTSEVQMDGPFPPKVWIEGIAAELRRRDVNPEEDSNLYVQDAFPHNTLAPYGIVLHYYPRSTPEVQRLYLDRMSFVMTHIENCLLRPVPNTPLRNVLALLAEYYHVGINAHLFQRANNSLLMGHVNYFLRYLGLNGIRHQYWDYTALINHSGDFERIFIQAIQETNPNIDINTI